MLFTSLFQSVSFADAATEVSEYEIYPIPQSISYTDGKTTFNQELLVEYDTEVDDQSKVFLEETLTRLPGVSLSETSSNSLKVEVQIVDDTTITDYYTPTTGKLFTNPDAYVLEINADGIFIAGNDNDAIFAAIATLRMMVDQSSDGMILNNVVEDFADVEYRGVIEGYYGIPWSNEAVISYMEFGQLYKMNTFIFAPKDDPYHNSKWREPYPVEDLEKMEEMIEAGTRTKVRFVYAIHPFMTDGLDKENFDDEIKAITDKFDILYDLGVRQFALLADDAVSETALQVKTTNALTEWVDSKGDVYPLIFCPQAYSGTPSESYFSEFDHGTTIEIGGVQQDVPAVAEEVEIMYTGSQIVGNVDDDVNTKFYDASGRYPYFWLNWPVNDYTDSTLFLGKAEVLKANNQTLNGLVANPMVEEELSKVGLFQIADYAWNIEAFDVDASWAASFKYVDSEIGEALGIVAKHMSYPKDGVYHQLGLTWEESEYLTPYIDALKTKFESGEDATEEAQALKRELEIVLDASNTVMTSNNTLLVSEYAPYHESFCATLEANIAGLDSLIAYYSKDYDLAFSKYGEVAGLIDDSNSVTKEGYKPGGYIDLEVKPSTKYLRPLAIYLNDEVGVLMNEMLGLSGGADAEATAIYNFSGFSDASSSKFEALVDGDDSTTVNLTGGTQQIDDYFGVDLGSVQQLETIHILQGNNDTDHDRFHHSVVEVSTDGINYTVIEDYSAGNTPTDIYIETNVNARYVRLRTTLRGTTSKPDYWFNAREFSVTVNDGPKVIQNTGSNENASISNEESVITLSTTDYGLENNQYVGIDLSTLVRFKVASDLADETTIQVSENGKVWIDIVDFDEYYTARYVRYINTTANAITSTNTLTLTKEVSVPSSVFYTNASGEVDLYASANESTTSALFNVTGLENKEHTITIYTHGEMSSDKVSLDKFVVSSDGENTDVNLTTSTENLVLESYGSSNWSVWSSKTGWLNNDELYFQDSTGSMTYTFTGDGISLHGVKGTNFGSITYYVDGVAYDNSGDAIFDGKDSTVAHYYTDHVVIDLGKSTDINNIKVKVGEDINAATTDYVLGSGSVMLSSDGVDYTSVRDFNVTGNSQSDDGFNGREAPYFFIDINTTQSARYIKIQLDNTKEFKVNEVVVNDGNTITKENLALSTTSPQSNSNLLANAADRDLSTTYVAGSDGIAGNVTLTITDPNVVLQATIMQSSSNISNAKFEVLETDTWTTVGTLSQSINVFDLESYENILALRVSYNDGQRVDLLDMTYLTGATHTVTIDIDGTTSTHSIIDGKTLPSQSAPSIAGKEFKGWFVGDVEYDFSTPVTSSFTLTAKFSIIDKTALSEKIKEVEMLDLDTYDLTNEQVEAITTALEAATVVEADAMATQDQIDSALETLTQSVDGITLKGADYSSVDTAIENIPNELSNFTSESLSKLQEALDAVIDDYDITKQDEVDAMAKAITDALDSLDLLPADYSVINTAKENIPSDLSLYTDESVSDLQAALDAVTNDYDITKQDEVDAMAKAITDAIAALDLLPADYSAITDILDKIAAMDLDKYYSAKQVMQIIVAIEYDKNINQQNEVDTMASDLQDAFDALTPKDISSDIKGANQEITSIDDYIPFIIDDATLEDFVCVYINGTKIMEPMYRLSDGSIVVELAPELLATLAQGEHTLEIVTDEMVYTTPFTVAVASTSTPSPETTPSTPSTGDTSNTMFFLLLGCASMLVARKTYKKIKA